jgi:hypothetical protein
MGTRYLLIRWVISATLYSSGYADTTVESLEWIEGRSLSFRVKIGVFRFIFIDIIFIFIFIFIRMLLC